MAAVQVRARRRRSLGQIPLSSSEIELYTRQDEMARRRRRLLAVRDEERRLAQLVTQRYRTNLQKLLDKKNRHVVKNWNSEQQQVRNELRGRYGDSIQSMGTAHRNARMLLAQFMEQAEEEKAKWAYTCQVVEKKRTKAAIAALEEKNAENMAKRRHVEEQMAKRKVLSSQQRQRARARAGQEQEVARQQAKDCETLETLRNVHSPEEVVVTPKPRQNDVTSYRYTRNHCLSTLPVEKERSDVTVVRRNRRHPTAMRGEEEAMKYRDEIDQTREQNRVITEAQEKIAAQRGRQAVEKVAQRKNGQQTLEWLALVDKMERRARGHELGGGNHRLMDTRAENSEKMAEQVFAKQFGLDEVSAHLSTFSIDTEENQSIDLAASSHSRGDIVCTESTCQKQLEATKRSVARNLPQEFQGRTINEKSAEDSHSVALTDSNHGQLDGDEVGDSGDRGELKGNKRSGSLDKTESGKLVARGKRERYSPKTTSLEELQQNGSKALEEESEKRERAFSIDKEDSQSVDLPESYQKSNDIAHAVSCGDVKLEAAKCSGFLDSLNEVGSWGPSLSGKSERVTCTHCESLMSTSSFGDSQRDEGKKPKNLETIWDEVVEERGSKHGDKRNTSKSRTGGDYRDERDSVPIATCPRQRNEQNTHRNDRDTSAKLIEEDEYLRRDTVELSLSAVSVEDKRASFKRGEPSKAVRRSLAGRADIDSARYESNEVESNDSLDQAHDHTMATDDDAQNAFSASSFAPSQNSFSRRTDVMNEMTRSLGHRRAFADYSDDDGEVETESQFSSIGSNKSDTFVGTRNDNLYRQQMNRQAWRRSISDVSVVQFSLPSSDTQSSFSESLNGQHVSNSNDSFVNELVPLFSNPNALPLSDHEDHEALEDYDVYLVTPEMHRMVPSERRMRQHRLVHEKHTDFKRAGSTSSSDSFRSYPLQETILLDRGTQSEQEASLDLSNESATSSLGSLIELKLAAGTTRRRGQARARECRNEVDKQRSESRQTLDANSMVSSLTEDSKAKRWNDADTKAQVALFPLSPWRPPPERMQNVCGTFDDSIRRCSDADHSAFRSPCRRLCGSTVQLSHSTLASPSERQSRPTHRARRHSIYGAEEERKQDDASSETSGASLHDDASRKQVTRGTRPDSWTTVT